MRAHCVLVFALLAGCASDSGVKPAKVVDKVAPKVNPNPYPSTYKPYPGVPTLVRNVTVYDGEGGRIEHGSVLFADGKKTLTFQLSALLHHRLFHLICLCCLQRMSICQKRLTTLTAIFGLQEEP